MNQELIDMAKQAGLKVTSDNEILPSYLGSVSDGYFKLAKLAVKAEREACAKLCEEYRDAWLKGLGRYEFMGEGADLLADFIRARGETK
jgi:hypothetical protein